MIEANGVGGSGLCPNKLVHLLLDPVLVVDQSGIIGFISDA
ncbi:hypothetical protein [Marinobacter sp.]|jgi:hypothetical protein|nr:hypothetical protein [Marinobacter sp.]